MNQDTHLAVERTNPQDASGFLKRMHNRLGSVVISLSDVFAVHLLLTDYHFVLDKRQNTLSLTKTDLVEGFTYMTVKHRGQVVPPGTLVGIHIPSLDLRCLVMVGANNFNTVISNKSPLNACDYFVAASHRLGDQGPGEVWNFSNNKDDIISFAKMFLLMKDDNQGRLYVPEWHPKDPNRPKDTDGTTETIEGTGGPQKAVKKAWDSSDFIKKNRRY